MDTEQGLGSGRKSPLMVVTFQVLWVLPLVYYSPRLWRVVATSGTVLELGLLVSYCVLLIFFWLLTAHYTTVVLFYFLSRPLPPPPSGREGEWPPVAVLYPTCNDFQAEAAASCLNQDYPNFHVFLLDDSTQAEFRTMVETFHAAHPHQTTIVRRPSRQGFKAGNLNHALCGAATAYPFFAVVDADERLPHDFLQRTVPYLQDAGYAFVQANHAPNPDQDSAFARDLAATILPFWHVHCRPRNRYGFVVFLGHGALVRRSAWETVGGFPEVATEDLAFSAVLGERGMRGVFLEDLVCGEDFPTSYLAFKRQHERFLVGTTQVLLRHAGPLFRSRKISLVEKIDFLMWCSPLYVPSLVLVFSILCSLGLAAAFGQWRTPTVSVLGHPFVLPPVRLIGEPFNQMGSCDFQLFSVLCALSPAFASIALGLRRKLRLVRLLFLGTVPYLSLTVVAWRGVLKYVLTGKVLWPPTGEQAPLTGSDSYRAWRAPMEWEIGIGALLAITSLASLNLAAFAVSSCLLIGAGIQVLGWENKLVRKLSAGCFVVILLQMVSNITLFVQSPAPLVFTVHF